MKKKPPSESPSEAQSVAPRGRKVIGAGVAVLAVGFFVLSFADPMGRNWASLFSPLLILGGYALIGTGIFLPASEPEKTIKEI